MKVVAVLVHIVFCSLIGSNGSTFIHPYLLNLYKHRIEDKVWTFTDTGDYIDSSVTEDGGERSGCSESMANWVDIQSMLAAKKSHVIKSLWRFNVQEKTRPLTCSHVVVTVRANFTGSGRATEVTRTVRFVSGSYSRWIEVDLGKLVLPEYYQNTSTYAKLLIQTSVRCLNASGFCGEGEAELPLSLEDLRRVQPVKRRHKYTKQPLLAVFQASDTRDDSLEKALHAMTRNRRGALLRRHSRSDSRPRNCHLDEFIVETTRDLPDLNIVLPKQFNLGFCKGPCPFSAMLTQSGGLEATNHALVATRLANTHPTVPRATCVPTSYSNLLVIMDMGGSMTSEVLFEIKATGCACR
uniref:Transforming growth factor beta D HduTGFbD n=1 Tax=Halisarca dujardinii TaxID=2583056 RepID=A0A8F8ARJ6_HALDU|nr:transforming growth factor beta D HduTGFbD [Halisarca dujardinii]